MQEKFNWGAVAASAITSGIGAGIGAVAGAGGIAGQMGVTNSIAAGAINGAINNVIGQGVNIVLGQQKSFSWTGLAGAAVGGAVGGAVKDMNIMPGGDSIEGKFASKFLMGVGSGVLKAVASGGKVDMAQIAADSFGNALGNAIVDY